MTLFAKFPNYDAKFWPRLGIQGLTLKLNLSDVEANSSAKHLQIQVLDKIILFNYEYQKSNV